MPFLFYYRSEANLVSSQNRFSSQKPPRGGFCILYSILQNRLFIAVGLKIDGLITSLYYHKIFGCQVLPKNILAVNLSLLFYPPEAIAS